MRLFSFEDNVNFIGQRYDGKLRTRRERKNSPSSIVLTNSCGFGNWNIQDRFDRFPEGIMLPHKRVIVIDDSLVIFTVVFKRL